MIEKKQIGNEGDYKWIDIVNPTKVDLEDLAYKFNLDQNIVLDCLDPEHLPKHEHINGGEFFILRTFDLDCHNEADTTQELTRKIALFKSATTLITIHRSKINLINEVFNKWHIQAIKNTDDITMIIYEILLGVFRSYDKPVVDLLNQLEKFEMSIFNAEFSLPFEIKHGYFLKRKSFVFKRIIRSMIEVANKLYFKKTYSQNLLEEAEGLFFYCEEIIESTNSLLSLQVSFAQQQTNEAAQKTNEVIRVLTIFSMFLLPLNVITGIYGMNFHFMPELTWPNGYIYALALMALISLTIFLWFKKKGWLKNINL